VTFAFLCSSNTSSNCHDYSKIIKNGLKMTSISSLSTRPIGPLEILYVHLA